MFEVRVAGGINDGKILGEFLSYEDAWDMVQGYEKAYGTTKESGLAVVVDQEGDD